MGCFKLSSSRIDSPQPAQTGNPNPLRFRVVHSQAVGHFLLAVVHYPDCTNFEGQKILVFENLTPEELARLKQLDPHFSTGPHIHPVARFEPTVVGWRLAICMASMANANPQFFDAH